MLKTREENKIKISLLHVFIMLLAFAIEPTLFEGEEGGD